MLQRARQRARVKRRPRRAPSPALQAGKQQLVRSAIWEAATDLFGEKGYDETTVEDIAEKAGVSRRSFFRYFASKSELMAFGVMGYGAAVTDAIQACPASASPREVFRRTVAQTAQQCAAHGRTRKIMEIAAKYPEAREALSRTGQLQQRVEEAFAQRCGKDVKQDLTPGILAWLTLAALSVIFRAWFEQGWGDIAPVSERVLATMGQIAR
jgi:AcrR family transcriptional regulator